MKGESRARQCSRTCASVEELLLQSTLYFPFSLLNGSNGRAVSLADDVCSLTREFRRCHFVIADLNRASASIPANVAEGNG